MGQTKDGARVALGAALVLLAPALSCMPPGSSASPPPPPPPPGLYEPVSAGAAYDALCPQDPIVYNGGTGQLFTTTLTTQRFMLTPPIDLGRPSEGLSGTAIGPEKRRGAG